ncbi:MAG: hypothetical protein GY938_24535 [Ketobacter sp.]|nr:hypothetical protein [Ketobacter sp.]
MGISGEQNYRSERITRLITELKYEITRGMMEGDIEEEIGFQFVVPVSKNLRGGVVECRFMTYPVSYSSVDLDARKLKLVKKE